MNSPNAYISYFRNLASNHIPSLGFYIMDINEVLESLRSGIAYPAMILINYNGNLLLRNADNPINEVAAGFIIIDHVLEQDDFVSEQIALNNSWERGRRVLARMFYEKLKGDEALAGFNLNTVKYEMMGPLFDNDFGFMFTWKVDNYFPVDFDKSLWLDYAG